MENEPTPQPTPPAFQPQQSPTPATQKKKGYKWPIILMVWPATLIILAIALFALSALFFPSPAQVDGCIKYSSHSTRQSSVKLAVEVEGPYGKNIDVDDKGCISEPESTSKKVSNIILFLIGAISISLGPISFIIGLVLLILAINENKKRI